MGGKWKQDLRTPWYWLVLLANWALVPFAWLTWQGGGLVWGAYLLIQVGTIILNDKITKSRRTLAFLCVNLLAATVIAHKLSTQLYAENVNDYLTLALGELGMIGGAGIVVVISAFVIAARGWKRKA